MKAYIAYFNTYWVNGSKYSTCGMDAVYIRFDSYDFDGDPNFQSGLKNLQASSEEIVLGIKLFFYNRFVEPIDLDGYKQRHLRSTAHSSTSSMVDNIEQLEKFDHLTIADSDSGVCESPSCGTSLNTDAPISFEDVICLVQAGEEVPGLSKLDIKPNNHTPTPSQMERRLKPWEKS
ncbi:hypothetical protein DPEC_G00011390 [Dallia pectoralis]|uniref:Uncharacterized protein n=1 Tax=Dallia pectoralis TaxID=75939 RepID=A0ACC2HLB8_DALPE|nr:hypothetical protein DPEC_G00011390 [Dallia pectoralis]